jgi:hypothetical protein
LSGHKAILKKIRIEIISNMFFKHKSIELEIHHRRKIGNFTVGGNGHNLVQPMGHRRNQKKKLKIHRHK